MEIKKEMKKSRRERGATMIEYALVVGLVVVAGVVALQNVGSNTGALLNEVGTKLSTATQELAQQ